MTRDLISREDAMMEARPEYLSPEQIGHEEYNKGWSDAIKAYWDNLNNLPAKTQDRPKGEWLDMADFEQCSVCKGTHLKEFQSYYGKTTWVKTPYCPNCGADMRGEDE